MRVALLTFSLILSSLSFATQDKGIFAHIETNKGEIIINLEYQVAPLTVINFVSLAEGTKVSNKAPGVPFYDGVTFHRVIANFMIQGGDPEGTGRGGPGYKFVDEFSDLKHDRPGILSMANSGPDTNGSQFFITHIPTPWLDGKHSVLGTVTTGMDVVNNIEQGDVIEHITIKRLGQSANNFATGESAFQAELTLRSLALEEAQKTQQEIFEKLVTTTFPKALLNAAGYFTLITQEGSGKNAQPGDNISLDLAIELIDGTVLQAPGNPIQFKLGYGEILSIIDNATFNMTIGEERLVVTSHLLAFGDKNMGIPLNSILVFKLKRLSNNE